MREDTSDQAVTSKKVSRDSENAQPQHLIFDGVPFIGIATAYGHIFWHFAESRQRFVCYQETCFIGSRRRGYIEPDKLGFRWKIQIHLPSDSNRPMDRVSDSKFLINQKSAESSLSAETLHARIVGWAK